MHMTHTWSSTFKACEEAIYHHHDMGFRVASMVNEGRKYHVYYERQQQRHPNSKQVFKTSIMSQWNLWLDWKKKKKLDMY